MPRDTSEKSAERFFAERRKYLLEDAALRSKLRLKALRRSLREKQIKKKQIENHLFSLYTIEEKKKYGKALRLLSSNLSYAGALAVTEDKDWRAERLAKIAKASEVECDTVVHE